jgi:hypothetical protein
VAFGQITIQSLRQSHIEPLERRYERKLARQRAKVVVVEVEYLKEFATQNDKKRHKTTKEFF